MTNATLVKSTFAGFCECGLMLSDADLDTHVGNYICPRCGASTIDPLEEPPKEQYGI